MKKDTNTIIDFQQENTKMKKYQEIFKNNDTFKLWDKLENGCYIGTLGYSEENVEVLHTLLKSFEEQYGEEIDYDAAKEELMLYATSGKLFIYFDEEMVPISMNGCIYNYDNETVDFISPKNDVSSLYFYGLSTIPKYRGKGACKTLVNYALEFAKYNNFDLVYARTDLVNSNSEWIMSNAGMEICKYEDQIIAEWVDVTENKGDYRLHMWKPFHQNIAVFPKEKAYYAQDTNTRDIIEGPTTYEYKLKPSLA